MSLCLQWCNFGVKSEGTKLVVPKALRIETLKASSDGEWGGDTPSQPTREYGEHRELPSGVRSILELFKHVCMHIANFGQSCMNIV